jgi:hypothetical protein
VSPTTREEAERQGYMLLTHITYTGHEWKEPLPVDPEDRKKLLREFY